MFDFQSQGPFAKVFVKVVNNSGFSDSYMWKQKTCIVTTVVKVSNCSSSFKFLSQRELWKNYRTATKKYYVVK